MHPLGRLRTCGLIVPVVLMSTLCSLMAAAQAPAPPPSPRLRVAPGEFLRPIFITGEVNKPGTFTVVDHLTIAQILSMAGGLTGNASGTAILVHFSDDVPLSPVPRATLVQWIRPGAAIPRHITLTRLSVVDTGKADQLHLEPQDILFFPGKNDG